MIAHENNKKINLDPLVLIINKANTYTNTSTLALLKTTIVSLILSLTDTSYQKMIAHENKKK